MYFFIYFYFLFSHGLSTKPATVGNCTHCCISHSEEIKYIADNSLSIREAGWYSEEQTKKIIITDIYREKQYDINRIEFVKTLYSYK